MYGNCNLKMNQMLKYQQIRISVIYYMPCLYTTCPLGHHHNGFMTTGGVGYTHRHTWVCPSGPITMELLWWWPGGHVLVWGDVALRAFCIKGGHTPPNPSTPPPPPPSFLRFPSFKKSKMYPPFVGLSGKQKDWITFLTNLYIISTLKVS